MLTTTFLACRCPVLIAPAMNTAMYQNPIVQDNLKKLAGYGCRGDRSCQRMAGLRRYRRRENAGTGGFVLHIEKEIACPKDMQGLNVLVTAGPTRESLDPVRYITNHSSGKMGYALAKAAMLRGAKVTLVSGPVSLTPPLSVKVIPIVSAQDMYQAVTENFRSRIS